MNPNAARLIFFTKRFIASVGPFEAPKVHVVGKDLGAPAPQRVAERDDLGHLVT